jgi:hypothetical protein
MERGLVAGGNAAMNLSILRRVIWKEYRLQRPLWLVVTALAILADLLTLWCDPNPFYKMITLHYIALITPALYVLGCGATLFAGEHEAETYEFQRSLPVGAMSILVGKVVLVILSAVAMVALMVSFARLLAPLPALPQGTPAPWRLLAWATVGFFTVEMFVWAVFFSLLTKRVLVAAVLGVSAASLAGHLAAATITWNVVMETYVQAMPWRIGITAAVALADVWLAARWLREKRDWRSRSGRATTAEAPPQAVGLGDRFLGPQRLSILGRLVWQHWRQSRRMSLIISLLLVPLVALSIAWMMRANQYPAWFLQMHAGEIYLPTERLFFFLVSMLALSTVPMLGIGAFLGDQRRNSHRFLTDRGVPPKFVWLSRQLVTLGIPMFAFIALLLGLFFLASALLPAPEYSDAPQWISVAQFYNGTYNLVYFFLSVLGYVFIGITVGQFCSMFVRSPLLAGLFSVLLTGVLVVWCALMFYWHVNWLWSILPIPCALLLATRLRTADWLVERKGLRAWLRPALALLLPAAALLAAIPLYRVYSIPLVDPGFLPEELAQPLTPEEEKTLGLYEWALPILTPPPHKLATFSGERGSDKLTANEAAWVDLNSERITTALKASRRKIQHCPTGTSLPSKEKLSQLAQLLVCSAVVSEKMGELDAALDRYLAAVRVAHYIRNWYPIPLTRQARLAGLENADEAIETAVYARLPRWATRKDQTPERIIAATRRLEELTSETPSNNGVKLAYLQLRRFLSSDVDIIDDVRDRNLPMFARLWMRLPFERARAERLLNLLTRRQLDALSRVEETVRRSEPFTPPPCGPNVVAYVLQQSNASNALHTGISILPVEYDANWGEVQLVQDYVARVAAQRAVRIVLALEAWRLKHGDSLPKKLDELVGRGIDRLPVDPYSGKPYHYFRNGLKIPLRWSQPQLVTGEDAPPAFFARDSGTIAADRPFVWSSGNKLRYRNIKDQYHDVAGEYEIFTHIRGTIDGWRLPDSEFDVWQSGWPFPIPYAP